MGDVSKKRILLVEDEVLIAAASANSLEGFGYEVVTVHDGLSAVEIALSDKSISLILMDIDLGKGIDGTEAARRILAEKHVPIVFHTAHIEREMVEKVRHITRYGYIIKNSGNFVLQSSIEMAFELFDSNRKMETAMEQYRIIFENSGTSNAVFDENCRLILQNEYLGELLSSYCPGNNIGKTAREIFGPEMGPVIEERMRRIYETGEQLEFESQFTLPSGKKWFHTVYHPLFHGDGRIFGIQTISLDVTDRRHMEEALRESESRTKIISELTTDYIFIVDVFAGGGMKLRWASDTMKRETGRTVDDIPGPDEWIQTIHPDYRAGYAGFMKKVMQSPEGLQFECRSLPKHGGERWIRIVAQPKPEEGQSSFTIIGAVKDITESKKAELSLRDSEEKYRTLVENLSIGIFHSTMDGRFIHVNSVIARMAGYGSREEFMKMPARILYNDAADREYFVRDLQDKGKVKNLEVRSVRKDGTVYWISLNATVLKDAGGNPVSILGSVEDITDRRHMEEALRRSEEEYRSFIQAAMDGFVQMDMQGLILLVNDAYCKMSGFSESELLAMRMSDLDASENRDETAGYFREMITRGSVRFEGKRRRKDGSIYDVEVNGRYLPIGEGYVAGFIKDITERKKIEESLRMSEERFRKIFEQGPIGICLGGADFHYIRVNETLCSMLGYSEEELMRMTFPEITCQGNVEEDFEGLGKLNHGEIPSYRTEKQYKRKDGSIIWCGVTVTIMRDDAGNFLYYIVMVENIMERKYAEEKVLGLLREKEILLKEVHHRIKNNMTVIESIISLQSDTIKDKDALFILETARGRIQSMGILYDRLYRNDNYRDTELKDYLDELIDEILGMYPGHESILVEKRIESFLLSAEIIFPLGIIVNELITNIMKHAFVGRPGGVIEVEASKSGSAVSLVIQDNGIGIPESAGIDDLNGFGLELVRKLARQLHGTFRVERAKGTRCILEFNVENRNP